MRRYIRRLLTRVAALRDLRRPHRAAGVAAKFINNQPDIRAPRTYTYLYIYEGTRRRIGAVLVHAYAYAFLMDSKKKDSMPTLARTSRRVKQRRTAKFLQ